MSDYRLDTSELERQLLEMPVHKIATKIVILARTAEAWERRYRELADERKTATVRVLKSRK
jgi:hypothetical protein